MMELLDFPFFRNALVGIILISTASAAVGTYIVTRRMVFISGGITHACFGGLGLGYFLGWNPIAVAAVFAIGSALGVDFLSRRDVRRDSAIAVMWSLGMALGVLFVFLTPGYVPELNSFLFGNVLTIDSGDLLLFAMLAVVVLVVYALCLRGIVAVSFDTDFSRTRNLPVGIIKTVMTVLVAVTIVLSIRMIGIMLLMSLLSLPQMVGELYTHRYKRLMYISGIVSVAGCIGGLWLAYFLDVPASAAIVLLLVAIYGAARAGSELRRRRKQLRPAPAAH